MGTWGGHIWPFHDALRPQRWNFVRKISHFFKKIKCSKQPKKQNKLNFYFSLSGVPNVRGWWVGSYVWDKVPKKTNTFLGPSLSWYFQPGISASLSKPCQRGENFNWMLLPTWYYSPSHQTNSIFMQKFFIQYNQIFLPVTTWDFSAKLVPYFGEMKFEYLGVPSMERLSFPGLV